MTTAARHRLARLLAGEEAPSADSTSLSLPSDAVRVRVKDVGTLASPVRAPQAKRLISVARPARFGRGEETLSDPSVRDTWELTPDQVTLDGEQWEGELDAALMHVRDQLGLPVGGRLRAELHSLLVYGKGQFFLPHQDSEKHDDMVATLVVFLPSVHTGGELVVDDAGAERTYRGSRDDLVLVAFYADRRHQVRPVRSGYRVTLTFNLMLTNRMPSGDAGSVDQAADLLTRHFATPVRSEYGGHNLGEPRRLVLLLDHEYSQAGLSAQLFKGADGERVRLLRAATEQAGCELVLALAEVKETWSAVAAQGSWGYGGYADEFDDSDDDTDPEAGDDATYELNGLIDDELTLGWWVAFDGTGAEVITLPVSQDEVCAVTPSHSLTPYHSEYEGYMGNYGNTVDRWYRRAAVVVWPKGKSFAARAEAGSAWALRTLQHEIASRELERARDDARSLAPFWLHVEAELLAPALNVAAALRDPGAARVVLEPFMVEMLTVEHAPLLALLSRTYGDAWLGDLIERWNRGNRSFGRGWVSWVRDAFVSLTRALREHGEAAAGDQVCALVWGWLANRIEAVAGHPHVARRREGLADLAAPCARLLEAASDEHGAEIAATLRAAGDNVVELLIPALQQHCPPLTATARLVAEDCRTRLSRVVDSPTRAVDDWSITWTGCGCGECTRLGAFLASRSERTLEWPLAKPGRQHVHQWIEAAGLPVQHVTRRQGRPFTLILEKTTALFEQEKDVHRRAQRDLEWVTSVAT